jgi:hypothetical protein
MSFFKNFPTIKYDLNETGELIDVKNLFKHVDVNDIGIDSNISYTYYEIQSGERPDTVSQRLYGTTDYYWTFFILNDYLKEGLRAWPKSEQELERYITNEHDDHGVLVIPQEFDNPTSTLAGLDLTHPYLRVRRDDLTNAYALVDGYDPQTYQLNVYRVSNPTQFWDNPSRIRLEVYNPYNPVDGDNYQAVEALNLEWIASTYEWAEKNHYDVYDLFNGSYAQGLSLETTRTAFLNEWYNFAFGNPAGPYFTYATPFDYELGRNAPFQYLNAANEPITAYDALVTNVSYQQITVNTNYTSGPGTPPVDGDYRFYSDLGESGNGQWVNLSNPSFFEYFNTLNNGLGGWKWQYGSGGSENILDSSISQEAGFWSGIGPGLSLWTGGQAAFFNDSSIGTPDSNVPQTFTEELTPIFTTVVEHEREKNFAKRKIRVVKKSQIQEFVEEYRNLIQD